MPSLSTFDVFLNMNWVWDVFDNCKVDRTIVKLDSTLVTQAIYETIERFT